MKLYWTSAEIEILNPSAYEDCVGGFVYLFVKAFDVRQALLRFETALEDEGFKIDHVEFVSEYEQIPWDSKEEQTHYDGLAKEARAGENVVWDEIFAYESKDDQ